MIKEAGFGLCIPIQKCSLAFHTLLMPFNQLKDYNIYTQ